jgi:hypothetical protein
VKNFILDSVRDFQTFFKGDDMKNIMLRIAALGTAMVFAACSPQAAKHDEASAGQGAGSETPLVGKVQMSMLDSGGSVIYTDALANSSLRLQAGLNYTIVLDTSNVPAEAQLSLKITNISLVGATPDILTVHAGANSYSPTTAGDYIFTLTVSVAGMSPRIQSYQASVICSNPAFTADSLNPSSIRAAHSGGQNSYSFSASGVANGANGMGPYQCAWDPTGTGIVDTAFQSCDSALNNFYVDLVGSRNIGLVVKDSCNIAYTISNPQTLAFTEPEMPGNVFIYGVTDQNTSQPDARFDGVTYLATNDTMPKPVVTSYSGGSFSIDSTKLKYDMPSSVGHGMRIEIRGLRELVPLTPQGAASYPGADGVVSGAFDVSQAKLNHLTYSTDRAGDQLPQVILTSQNEAANCSYEPHAQAFFSTGTPCSDGSGTNNKFTVEVWGHYRCTNLKGADHSVVIEGDFDGYDTIIDNCVGGQGQQGGGVAPIGV